jgi:hypothetical protein
MRLHRVMLAAVGLAVVWNVAVHAASTPKCSSAPAVNPSVYQTKDVDGKPEACGGRACQGVQGGGCFGNLQQLSYLCSPCNTTVSYTACSITVDSNGNMTCTAPTTTVTATSGCQTACPTPPGP